MPKLTVTVSGTTNTGKSTIGSLIAKALEGEGILAEYKDLEGTGALPAPRSGPL